MRLCTRSRYGSRAMLDLAAHYGEGAVTIRDVSSRQEISERYLENLMAPLRDIGLVVTGRGKWGGYKLGCAPSDITVGEVVRALEGSLAFVPCTDNPALCHRASSCATRVVWLRLRQAMADVLDGITLADMVGIQAELSSKKQG